MNILNTLGPSMLPWGNRRLTFSHEANMSPILTLCVYVTYRLLKVHSYSRLIGIL